MQRPQEAGENVEDTLKIVGKSADKRYNRKNSITRRKIHAVQTMY